MPKISQTILFKDFKKIDKELFSRSDIIVFKTSFKHPLENKKWNTLINLLSADLKNEVEKYVRWEVQHITLIGKLLVHTAYFFFPDTYYKADTPSMFMTYTPC